MQYPLKRSNIGNTVRLLLDVIDYKNINDLPAAVLMLDIENGVSHGFLTVLEYFNFMIENLFSGSKHLTRLENRML